MQLPDNSSDIVQLICKLAQNKDEQSLKILLNEHCVGEFVNGTNAVRELAKAGDGTAVNFLIGKFAANINDAVMGAAENGHINLMNKLLAKGALPEYALGGAVLGNETKLIDTLLETSQCTKFLALENAASRVELRPIYNLLIAGRSVSNLDADDGYGSAIVGAASNEDRAMVTNILTATKHPTLRLKEAISGAAKAGKIAYYNELLKDSRLSEPELRKEALNCALRGASFRNAEEEMNTLLAQGASRVAVVEGASEGGKFLKVKSMLASATSVEEKSKFLSATGAYAAAAGHYDLLVRLGGNISDIVRNAAAVGHWHILNTYATQLSAEAFKEYFFIHHTTGIDSLRIASQIDHPNIRRHYLSNSDLTFHCRPNTENVDIKTKKAGVLNRLIRKYDLNYDQAVAWNTPRVHAWVQSKNTVFCLMKADCFYRILQMVQQPLTYSEAVELTEKMLESFEKIRKARASTGFFSATPMKIDSGSSTDSILPNPSSGHQPKPIDTPTKSLENGMR